MIMLSINLQTMFHKICTWMIRRLTSCFVFTCQKAIHSIYWFVMLFGIDIPLMLRRNVNCSVNMGQILKLFILSTEKNAQWRDAFMSHVINFALFLSFCSVYIRAMTVDRYFNNIVLWHYSIISISFKIYKNNYNWRGNMYRNFDYEFRMHSVLANA